MKYKAVIFDLYGTLIDNVTRSAYLEGLRKMAAELPVSPDDFLELWHASFNDRMKGVIPDCQTNIRHICGQLGMQTREDQIESAASIWLDMNIWEVTTPRDGAVEVLSHLKAAGSKTGLLSDCSKETTIAWKQSPLASLIDLATFSSLSGMKKPDHRIYQLMTERLGVEPEECAYIADGMGGELAAAAELGMYAIQICVPEEAGYYSSREPWNGPVISSLHEVLSLVK